MRIVEEEIGGQLGMKLLVNTQEFKDLNVGFALDEGIVSTHCEYTWCAFA